MMRNVALIVCIGAIALAARCVAAPVYWSGSGNYYDLVLVSNTTWHDAKTAAEGLTFAGVHGHLANITSAGENEFLDTTFNTGDPANFAWIGGSEPDDDGVWRWAVGPEAGIQFSHFAVPSEPYYYANWGGIEPNDDKAQEDYAMFNIGLLFHGVVRGAWADASPTPNANDPVVGYLVEYEMESISEAKLLPDGQSVRLVQKAVTFASTDFFYIEEDARNIGIRVDKAGHGLAVGMRASVEGTAETDEGNNERYIAASSATHSGGGGIAPVAMNSKMVGGGDWHYDSDTKSGQKGVSEGTGLNNIGLLVKVFGRYTQSSPTTFLVDDGAGHNIQCSAPSGFGLQADWDYVSVTGVISIRKTAEDIYLPKILVSTVYVITRWTSVWSLVDDWHESTADDGLWAYGWLFPSWSWNTLSHHTESYHWNGGPAWYVYTPEFSDESQVPVLLKSAGPFDYWDIPSGRVGGHTPVDGWPTPGNRSYSAVRWTAPADMSVSVWGDVWNALTVDERPQTLLLLVNGQALINELPVPPRAQRSSANPFTLDEAIVAAGGSASQLRNVPLLEGQSVVLAVRMAEGSLGCPFGVDLWIGTSAGGASGGN